MEECHSSLKSNSTRSDVMENKTKLSGPCEQSENTVNSLHQHSTNCNLDSNLEIVSVELSNPSSHQYKNCDVEQKTFASDHLKGSNLLLSGCEQLEENFTDRIKFDQMQNHSSFPTSSFRKTASWNGYSVILDYPYSLSVPDNHVPTWEHFIPLNGNEGIVPIAPIRQYTNEIRAFKLSLLSNKEFTISPIQHITNSAHFEPTLSGLRRPIKEITRKHGNGEMAAFEEGKWRIPLSAYYALLTYFSRENRTVLQPIPDAQLKILSLGRASAARGYPSPKYLIGHGVPSGVAAKLAPYQRGGVDFVIQRNGRALIADEMGLGKTLQGIASMTCFEDEWPLLVLCPSSTRYHWEAELLHWLGNSDAVQKDDMSYTPDSNIRFEEQEHEISGSKESTKSKFHHNIDKNSINNNRKKRRKIIESMQVLKPDEINVVNSSSDKILYSGVRVVVISYGLIPNLVHKSSLFPGQFKCCIVDESHMLKNKKSKRSCAVIPLLLSADRVVCLSGTPALNKPSELFPQLNVLGSPNGWWNDENDFHAKYVCDKYSNSSFCELHTLLTSTVMIRRMKNDILRDLSPKLRERVYVNIRDPFLMASISAGLIMLQKGKGILGKLSLLHQTHAVNSKLRKEEFKTSTTSKVIDEQDKPIAYDDFAKMKHLPTSALTSSNQKKCKRKALLNEIFKLTGQSKIPVVIDMLSNWLAIATNGKIVIFAHHQKVLDEIVNGAELSNNPTSLTKFIRIDGSTSPIKRHEQITSFQNDPSIRIAILSITAAGVGVALTAASTVWFAELFWTPAIMLQCEDRCHRIGQQSQVKILYIIGKNTIDEVLWILLQRKFRSLGEFVEGKEMMGIKLHSCYSDEIDIMNKNSITSDEVAFKQTNLDDVEVDVNALVNEKKIQIDFKQLAIDEQRIVQSKYLENKDLIDEGKKVSALTANEDTTKLARNNVICILDDDDDGATKQCSSDVNSTSENALEEFKKIGDVNLVLRNTMRLPKAKMYQIFCEGARYGIKFFEAFGRVLITHSERHAIKRGDILIAVNSWVLTTSISFSDVVIYLRQALSKPPVRLILGRDEFFTEMFEESLKKENDSSLEQIMPCSKYSTMQNTASNRMSCDVIDLLDD